MSIAQYQHAAAMMPSPFATASWTAAWRPIIVCAPSITAPNRNRPTETVTVRITRCESVLAGSGRYRSSRRWTINATRPKKGGVREIADGVRPVTGDGNGDQQSDNRHHQHSPNRHHDVRALTRRLRCGLPIHVFFIMSSRLGNSQLPDCRSWVHPMNNPGRAQRSQTPHSSRRMTDTALGLKASLSESTESTHDQERSYPLHR